ncbi:MAG: hypothetical protein R2811_00845 [Flavobacteriales bacterium]
MVRSAGGACRAGFTGGAATFFAGLVANFFTAVGFFATTFLGAAAFFDAVLAAPRAGAFFTVLFVAVFFFVAAFFTAATFLLDAFAALDFFKGAGLALLADLAADLPEFRAVGFFLAMARRVQSAVGQGSQKPSPTKHGPCGWSRAVMTGQTCPVQSAAGHVRSMRKAVVRAIRTSVGSLYLPPHWR